MKNGVMPHLGTRATGAGCFVLFLGGFRWTETPGFVGIVFVGLRRVGFSGKRVVLKHVESMW